LDRGVRPIGRWSTLINRSMSSTPSALTPTLASRSMSSIWSASSTSSADCIAVPPDPRWRVTTSPSTLHTRVDFPDPETPVTAVNTPSGRSTSRPCRLWKSMPRSFNLLRGVRRFPASRAASSNR
jgi:hypothetical protein